MLQSAYEILFKLKIDIFELGGKNYFLLWTVEWGGVFI